MKITDLDTKEVTLYSLNEKVFELDGVQLDFKEDSLESFSKKSLEG